MLSIDHPIDGATDTEAEVIAPKVATPLPEKPERRWRSIVEIAETGNPRADGGNYAVFGSGEMYMHARVAGSSGGRSDPCCLLCGEQSDDDEAPDAELHDVGWDGSRWTVCLHCALSDVKIMRARAIAQMDHCIASLVRDWKKVKAEGMDPFDVDAVACCWTNDITGLSRFLAEGFRITHTDAKRIVGFAMPDEAKS